MNILITGGAGFIGSRFIHYMLAKYPEYRIICLDKLTYAGDLATLQLVIKNPRFYFVKADICDKDLVAGLFAEEHPDLVVNFAAESHVDRSIASPDVFLHTNIIGTGVLLDACRKHGNVHFHQISTDEVYGDLPLGESPVCDGKKAERARDSFYAGTGIDFFTEQSPLRPSSPYSASKAAADLLVLACRRTYGLPVTISRSSNNYGPWQYPEKLIPLMIINCLQDKPLPVYGDGCQMRDWLYVEDHCKAIDLIIHKGRDGDIYNIGGHSEMRNIDVVRLICRELGKPESLIVHVPDRQGHDLRYAVDCSKISRELGWRPQTKFEEGLKKTIEWYVGNKDSKTIKRSLSK